MIRSWGPIIMVIVSLGMAVIGFRRLLMAGRQKTFFMFLAGVVAYPIVLFLLASEISDRHLRLWVLAPIACLYPVWLLTGFFVYDASEKAKSKHTKERTIWHKSGSTMTTNRRILGLIFSIVGIILWVYGATHPEMTKYTGAIIMGGFLYALLIGLCWLITGKRIDQM